MRERWYNISKVSIACICSHEYGKRKQKFSEKLDDTIKGIQQGTDRTITRRYITFINTLKVSFLFFRMKKLFTVFKIILRFLKLGWEYGKVLRAKLE